MFCLHWRRPPLLLVALLIPLTLACSKKRDPATQLLHDLVESASKEDRAAVAKIRAPGHTSEELDDTCWTLAIGGPARCQGEGLKAGNKRRTADSPIVDGESYEKVMLITSNCGEKIVEDGTKIVLEANITIVSIDGQWFKAGHSQLEDFPPSGAPSP